MGKEKKRLGAVIENPNHENAKRKKEKEMGKKKRRKKKNTIPLGSSRAAPEILDGRPRHVFNSTSFWSQVTLHWRGTVGLGLNITISKQRMSAMCVWAHPSPVISPLNRLPRS